MVVSWQVLAAVAAVFFLAWTRMFASWGRLRMPAAVAAILVIANAVVYQRGGFSEYQYATADAMVAVQPDAGSPARRSAAPQGRWTLGYRRTGGIAGVGRAISVTDGGQIAAREGRLGQRAVGQASPELMERLSAFLRTARPAEPKPEQPVRDGFGLSLTLTDDRGERALELPGELIALLDDTLTRTLREGVVGSWEQAAWKPCRPMQSITALQIDPQIGPLELGSDGRFSVRWMGAGAQPFPEYHGRYRANPASGSIRFELDDPLAARDFAGTGRIRIDTDVLRLEEVWFGTVQAESKPDICELTFRRISVP